jgi:protein-S-isoprenylcysteine O-methyltransferase Ste14
MELSMKLVFYFLLSFLLLLFAYLVFRRIVRRDYRDRGHLSRFASSMQLLVFVGYFGFPYIFNPPEWTLFWELSGPAPQVLQIGGLAIIVIGFVVAFGTMAWFGISKAFGVKVEGLTRQGPYRVSRNPQILGGYLLIVGTSLQ